MLVRRDLRALTKRPCKFLKKGCKKGDKCRQYGLIWSLRRFRCVWWPGRFSHNEFAADLGEEGLAAGRRLPAGSPVAFA